MLRAERDPVYDRVELAVPQRFPHAGAVSRVGAELGNPRGHRPRRCLTSVQHGQFDPNALATEWRGPAAAGKYNVINVKGSRGVQIGDGNTQVNNYGPTQNVTAGRDAYVSEKTSSRSSLTVESREQAQGSLHRW